MKERLYNATTCTGCAACANICPKGAIEINENKDGYYCANVIRDKCINCGLCKTICPEINPIKKNNEEQEVYACQSNDELRYISSSGGVFTPIAELIIRKGGCVAGVVFNENWKVCHALINNLADIDKMRRSKYVQSFISEEFYKKIKSLLDNRIWVLFTGCPCQVAGLKKFLNKEYNNLVTIDLLCAHSASPKAYRSFLKDNYPNEKIQSINFRSKIIGWDSITTVTTDKNPTEIINHNFMKAFVHHLLMNEPCKKCKYHSSQRVGDITMGDFWGIGFRIPHLDDRRGTSCVILNNLKGKKIFSEIKDSFILCEKLSMGEALKSNWVLQGSFKPHKNIDKFNENLDTIGFNKNVGNCLNNKPNIAVLGWFWVPNIGAILTNYALNEIINKLGYKCETIDFIPDSFRQEEYENNISEVFTNKYIKLTKRVNNYNDLLSLNSEYSTFIVGSDQLWSWQFRKYPLGHLFLNFVNGNNKRISYSTSFGNLEKWNGPDLEKYKIQHWLSRFNNISVREYDGIKILKEDFDITGVQVMDPVFLCPKEKYNDIILNSKRKDTDFVAYYFIDKTNAKMNIVKKISSKYGIKNIVDLKEDLQVEDWLYLIKNCSYLVTDSFHATCFAMIFNKEFIVINVVTFEKPSRIETILSITGLQNKFLNDSSQIDRKMACFEKIDYEQVNKRLSENIEKSLLWLKSALESPIVDNLTKEQKMYDVIMNDMYDTIETQKKTYTKLQKQLFDEQKKWYLLYQNRLIIKFKYYLYRFLSNLCWGSLREKFYKKKKKYLAKIKLIST